MAKIPEETLTEIKTQTDLVALIQSRGVSLKQQGANWTGFCPFHEDEKTPNLVVTPGKGLWRCMATGCGKSGNAIQFVEAFDGVSFRHACELLSNGGVVAFTQTSHAKQSTVRKLPCPLDEGATDAELMRQVVEFYHERLTQTPAALEYLESRRLNDEGLIKRFKVGVADRLLGLRLPQKNRRSGDVLRSRLMELGVYRKSGHEHLNGCVVVPIYDVDGSCIRQLYGRRLDAKAPKEKRHLYLSGRLRGVFNAEALKSRDVILCESVLDAMTFVRHGMESATCTFGTANFTDEIFEAIQAAKVESVRLGFDADEAGDAAAEKAAERLQSIGVECYRVRLPWGSDANSFAVEQGGEALKRAVRSAAWLGAGKVAKGRNAPESPEESPPDSSTSSSSLAANSLVAKAENGSGAGKKVVLAKATPDAPERPELPKQEKRQPAKSAEVVPVRRGEFWELEIGERMYRVGGLERNNTLDVLKMTLRLMEPGGLFHLDAIDLVKNADRRKFIDHAASETRLEKELIKRDLGKLLLACEGLQENRLTGDKEETENVVVLEPLEEAEALELLRDPELISKLSESFGEAGIVGETTNVLAAYLACTSRLVDRPLAVIIQSTSAAGKTTLMEAVLSFFPAEDQVKYSAMTGQSLYYLGEKNLKHRILAIVEEEGAEKASYALKLLQSEGELTIASTGKDPNTGQMQTQDYHVEGPVSILLTTTSIDIDEELMNRCLILTVDESREQTERIHALQRQARTLEGLRLKKKRSAILTLLQNAQRLLRPVDIINPWAAELTFTSERTRTRRDHEKYLTLIEAVTLLHQHQREVETDEIAGEHIKTTFQDIEIANKLAPEVLGRSLDELPPQTRRFLELVKDYVREQMAERETEPEKTLFSRREIRERVGWGQTQVRLHLERLAELEYLAVRHGRGGIPAVYELLISAEAGDGVGLVGLLEVEKLKQKHGYGE